MDTSSNASMWRDRVNVELNRAVLHSYAAAGVSAVDHLTQADQFMAFFREEHRRRGGCPADWVWIVPPESGALTLPFHQEMLNYQLSPMYAYQVRYRKLLPFKFVEVDLNCSRLCSRRIASSKEAPGRG